MVFRVFVVLLCAGAVCGDLKLGGNECGTVACAPHQYCNPHFSQCSNCSDVCDRKNHNYQEKLCEQQCQDYIHDVKYVQTGKSLGQGGVDEDIKKLYALVSVALVLIILLILVLLLLLGYKFYIWSKTHEIKDLWKNISKKNDDVEKSAHPNNGIPPKKSELKLDIPPVAPPESPVTVTTTITSRRPAEDSTLDYAYDNHAMSGMPSPHSNKNSRESNF